MNLNQKVDGRNIIVINTEFNAIIEKKCGINKPIS